MRTLLRLSAMAAALIVSADLATADLLRVGKAGREAFSFVPVDVGVHTGAFMRQNLDIVPPDAVPRPPPRLQAALERVLHPRP